MYTLDNKFPQVLVVEDDRSNLARNNLICCFSNYQFDLPFQTTYSRLKSKGTNELIPC